MPSASNGSLLDSGEPDQPIQAPCVVCMTGSSALTRPPGERCQMVWPSAVTVRSTGRRLATTTNSYPTSELLWSHRPYRDRCADARAGPTHRRLGAATVWAHEGWSSGGDRRLSAAGPPRRGRDGHRVPRTGRGRPGRRAQAAACAPGRRPGGAQPSAAGDWWGWAALLAFAATGRPPFGRGTVVAQLNRARTGEVDLAGVDRRVAAALRSALAVDPWRRAAPDALVAELRVAAARAEPPEPEPAVTAENQWRTRLMPVRHWFSAVTAG